MGENKYQHIAEEIIKIVGKENIYQRLIVRHGYA